MQDFLQQTLNDAVPDVRSGENLHCRWRWLDDGILSLTPLKSAQRALVLSAGVHGNETAPVEIVNQLVMALLQGAMPLHARMLVILGNPEALRAGKRYQQADMNRLFGGRWKNAAEGSESQRAARLEQALMTFYQTGSDAETRWHLDLHTAIRGSLHTRFGLLPLHPQPWSEDFMRWLGSAGLDAVVFHRTPGGTFTHYSCETFQAESCTLELGKALPFGQNDLTQFASAKCALAALLSGDILPPIEPAPHYYQVAQQITRLSSDFVLHMGEDTLNFTPFSQGYLLAEDGETHYRVQHPQEYVLFPNPNVAIGLRAGLMLVDKED